MSVRLVLASPAPSPRPLPSWGRASLAALPPWPGAWWVLAEGHPASLSLLSAEKDAPPGPHVCCSLCLQQCTPTWLRLTVTATGRPSRTAPARPSPSLHTSCNTTNCTLVMLCLGLALLSWGTPLDQAQVPHAWARGPSPGGLSASSSLAFPLLHAVWHFLPGGARHEGEVSFFTSPHTSWTPVSGSSPLLPAVHPSFPEGYQGSTCPSLFFQSCPWQER